MSMINVSNRVGFSLGFVDQFQPIDGVPVIVHSIDITSQCNRKKVHELQIVIDYGKSLKTARKIVIIEKEVCSDGGILKWFDFITITRSIRASKISKEARRFGISGKRLREIIMTNAPHHLRNW